MRIRSRLYLVSALLFLTGIAAVFFRKGLSGAYGRHLSYNRLYFSRDQLHITGIRRLAGGAAEIGFAGAGLRSSNHFEVYSNGAKVLDQQAAKLTIRPGQGQQAYFVRINALYSFRLRIDMPEISIGSLPVLTGELELPQAWCMYDTLSGGESIVQHYLQDSMKILPGDASKVRVWKIARYILFITAGRYGKPADSLAGLSPVGQLRCVQRGGSRLLCGGYAGIFSFFSNKAGVPCRYIESGGQLGELSYSPHVVNEVWLKEEGCWAYTDLTDGIVFVKEDTRFLNAVEIQRQLRYYPAGGTSLRAFCYAGDSLLNRPFEEAGVSAVQAFDYNTRFTFYYGRYRGLSHPSGIGEKLESLLSPAAWYALYSDNDSSGDLSFYLRLISGYLFLLVALVWLVVMIGYLRSRRR